MSKDNEDWFGRIFAGGFGPRFWAFCGPEGSRGPRRRMRHQMFESGEVKYVILRLLKEKPRHGYEVIKALEEKMGGWYTPSAGTIYPTLQLLEDQGYVRVVETEGKKVYHITPEGRRSWRSTATCSTTFSGGCVTRCAALPAARWGAERGLRTPGAPGLRRSVARGPGDPKVEKILEILKKAAADIEAAKAPVA